MATFISKLIEHGFESEVQPNIALPTNDQHPMHLENVSDDLERLPIGWKVLLDTSISQEEQKKHPCAAINAIQYYTTEIQGPILKKPKERVRKSDFDIFKNKK
jgi:hypothetical protein